MLPCLLSIKVFAGGSSLHSSLLTYIQDVSQALIQSFAWFPLSLHGFFRIDIGTRCSICTALLQVLYAEVIPLTFWELQSGSPSGRSCLPNTTRYLYGRTPHLRGTASPLCSHEVVSYMLRCWLYETVLK